MFKSDKIVRSGLIYLAIGFLPLASNFLIAPIFTRVLSREEYGLLALASVLQAYLSVFLDMGFRGAFSRFYFDYYKKERLVKSLYATVYITLIGVALFIGLVLWFTRDWLFCKLFENCEVFSFYPYGYIVWLSATLILLQTITLSLYRNKENLKAYTTIAVSSFLLMTAGSVVGVLYFKQGALGSLAGKLAGTAIVIVPYAVYYFWKHGIVYRITFVKPLLLYGLPLLPYAALGLVMDNLDKFFVERYLGMNLLGLYNVAFLIGSIPSVLLFAVQSTINPQVFKSLTEQSRQYEESRNESIAKLFKTLLIFMCLVVTGIIALIQPAVSIFLGKDFVESIVYIPLIAMVFLPRSLYVVYTIPLFYEKKSTLLPITNFVAVLVGIAAAIYLVPAYQLMGICVTLLAMKVAQLLPTLYFLHRLNWLKSSIFRFNDVLVLIFVLAVLIIMLTGVSYYKPYLTPFINTVPFLVLLCYLGATRKINFIKMLKFKK
jgi:O-antigen/teichoic acid export membrane protein